MKKKIWLLSLLSITALVTSCASLPPKPKGNLCVFSVGELASRCQSISPSQVKVSADGNYYVDMKEIKMTAVTVIPVEKMEDWVTTDPDSWEQIQVYINLLRSRAQQCLAQ